MARWIGVDVGGKRKGFDVALIDDHRVLALEGGLTCDAVLEFVEASRPTLVAVDSPRCCAPDGQSTRAGERQLAKEICGIRWTPDASRVYANAYYAWIVEGLDLFRALAERGVDAIEVFPTASWTRWHGKRGARRRSDWSREALASLGLDGVPAHTNQDQRDAIAAAVTARDHTFGITQTMGEIVVPARRRSPRPLNGLNIESRSARSRAAGSSESSPLPFQGGMTLEEALRAGRELRALVEKRLPLQVTGHGRAEPMRLVGPALLARGAGTVQAIGALAPLDREADAGVLLRVLLEHMITLAWLSADPDHRRFLLWLKDDSKKRLAMHNDTPDSIGGLLPPNMEALFSGIVGTVDGAAPDTRTRAAQADAYWASRLPGVMHPGNDWGSFLGLYQIVFRYTSAFTHAGLLGLSAVTKRTPTGDVVEMETRQGVRSAVRMAPLAFGLGLYVSSVAQGWPERRVLDAIFEKATSA